ncbi:hypothetical protein HYH02_012116 [Chlamydomonas schloesseri]|uniref:Uncharacterized protein n=1 Tax=Chlamydomonas schloesseri TaxID=2026947 RepID=A0A835SXF9_9CHLO|nr:hypothetical protein HYH02_012116 [Chlamydomonas schloesseri]|eukprot:KAG2434918.1 hypothetical protein HYH02_012116 [Chlamydomonas schloesseri]
MAVVLRGWPGVVVCKAAGGLSCSAARPQGQLKPAPETPPLGTWCVQALVAELAPLSAEQLRQAAAARPDELLDSGFLFWLRDQERRAGLPGMAAALGQGQGGSPPSAELREAAARLGQELTLMREWVEEQANRKLLPSLASSLAYANLKQWRQETGKQAPRVAKGVDLDQLYRLGEEEEKKLRESLGAGGFGSGPRKGPATRSAIEEFTKHNKAYADLAAGAMARVRSRFMGFQDDGSDGGSGVGGSDGEGVSGAAQAVLRALLHGMGSTEERATFLPDAFTPPGLQIPPEAEGGKPSFVVTSPEALTAAIRARQAALSAQPAAAAATPAAEGAGSGASGATGGPAAGDDAAAIKARWRPGQGRTAPAAAAGADAASPQGAQAPQAQPQPLLGALRSNELQKLPCGQAEADVLRELAELVEEYDRAVFSRKTPLERMGHSSAPWLM